MSKENCQEETEECEERLERRERNRAENETGEDRILLKESDIPESGLVGRRSVDLRKANLLCFGSDLRCDRDDLCSTMFSAMD